MGQMAAAGPMGAVFRMIVPRMLADMDNVTEDKLASMLGVLAERIEWVRYGEATAEILEGPQPQPRLVQAPAEDDDAADDPLTTEG